MELELAYTTIRCDILQGLTVYEFIVQCTVLINEKGLGTPMHHKQISNPETWFHHCGLCIAALQTNNNWGM